MSNQSLNTQLIEAFGNLEQVLSDIYGEKHGVTAYINHMASLGINNSECFHVLNCLKEVRHKRNKLSHGEVSFSENYASKEDIEFIVDFKKSLFKQTDPISLAYKQRKTRSQKRNAVKNAYTAPPAPKKRSKKGAVCLVVILIALALILIYFFRK